MKNEFALPIYPTCPLDMTMADFAALIDSRPHCARLMRGLCTEPCLNIKGEYRVDTDHIVAKFLGGDNSLGNRQFLCIAENRWVKSINPDSWYNKEFWFDLPPSMDRLNHPQYNYGWEVVQEHAADFVNPPNVLFDRVLILAWMVGAGKTMGMLTVLAAINNVRLHARANCRRISRGVWFAPQKSVVSQIATELKRDVKKLNLWSKAPEVVEIKEPADWSKAQAENADIVVACPQAIWRDEGSRSESLSDDKLKSYLSHFEVVVFDEAHWGTEGLLSIVDFMPKDSFKFALTATPMDRDGRFFNQWITPQGKSVKDRFALFSVAGYTDVHRQGLVREIPAWSDGVRDGQYKEVFAGTGSEYVNGELKNTTNSTAPSDLVRSIKIILAAANQVEIDDKARNFDGHMIVVAESVSHAKHLCQNLRDQKVLSNLGIGWNAITCFSGKEGDPNYPYLIEGHPWLRSLDKNGKCDYRSARLMLVVDMATYGMNQKYAIVMVYAAKSMSLIEIAQRIGRLIRVTAPFDTQPIRIYFSSALGMAEYLQNAIDYLRNIPQRLKEAGFLTLSELLEQRSQINRGDPVSTAKLSTDDIAILDNELGSAILSSHGDQPSPEDEQRVITCWTGLRGDAPTEPQIAEAEDYLKNMRDPDFRKKRWVPISLRPQHHKILIHEEPPTEFPRDQIIQAIKLAILPPLEDESIDSTVQWVMEDEKAYRLYQKLLNRHEKQFYIRPPLVLKLNERARQIASELFRELGPHLQDPNFNKNIGNLCKCVNLAIAKHFCLPDIKETTPEVAEKQPQLVDAATRTYGARQIKILAKTRLIQRYPEMVPALAAVYAGSTWDINFGEDEGDGE